jgi:tetratricopeptide (TPR) repeat protein
MSPYHFNFSVNQICKLCKTILTISLALALTACQSTSKNNEEIKAKLIDTKIKLIQAKLDKGKALEAQFEAEPLVKKFPNNSKVLTIMGFTDLALKNTMRGLVNLNKAYKLDRTPSSALNLSSAYIEAKNYGKAMAIIDEGIAIAKKTAYRNIVRLHHNKGLIYEQRGLTTQAIATYKQGLYHSPGYVLTLDKLAKIYENQGKHEQAKILYKRFHYACNACYTPVRKLAKYALKNRKFTEARSLLKTFLSLESARPKDVANAQRLLNRINHIEASKNTKRNRSRFTKRNNKNKVHKNKKRF